MNYLKAYNAIPLPLLTPRNQRAIPISFNTLSVEPMSLKTYTQFVARLQENYSCVSFSGPEAVGFTRFYGYRWLTLTFDR